MKRSPALPQRVSAVAPNGMSSGIDLIKISLGCGLSEFEAGYSMTTFANLMKVESIPAERHGAPMARILLRVIIFVENVDA